MREEREKYEGRVWRRNDGEGGKEGGKDGWIE